MGSRSCRNRIGWTTPRVKPFSFAAATTRSAPSRFIAIGISTKVCLPWARAASAISAWVSLGPAMITTSTSGSSSASPRLVVHFLYPYFSANVAVVGGLLPAVGVAGDWPAGLAGRPTTVCSRASSTRRSASECQTPIMPWPTMQIFSIEWFLLFVWSLSTAETADRHARNVDLHREDAAGQRLFGQHLWPHTVPQRGDINGLHVRAAETRCGRIGARQRDAAVQPAIRAPPVQCTRGDSRAPIEAVLIGRGTVRSPDLFGRSGDDPATRDRSGRSVVVIRPDHRDLAVGVVHRLAVGAPGQTVRHDQLIDHAVHGAIRIEPIQRRDRPRQTLLVHGAGEKPAVRGDLAVVEPR